MISDAMVVQLRFQIANDNQSRYQYDPATDTNQRAHRARRDTDQDSLRLCPLCQKRFQIRYAPLRCIDSNDDC